MRNFLAVCLLAALMLGAAPCNDETDDGDGVAEGEGSAVGQDGAAGQDGDGTARPGGGDGSGEPGTGGDSGDPPAEGDTGDSGDGSGGDDTGDPAPGGDSGEPPAEGDTGGDGDSGGDGGDGDSGDGGDGDGSAAGCDLDCEVGTHCELVEVVCITEPCLPVPECVDSPFCGGIAAFTCAGAGDCIDDPRDDCAPPSGADCGGVCVCPAEGTCGDGQVWNANPEVCACEAADGGDGDGSCGGNTCKDGEYCCNRSCGICAPNGGACTQQFCG